MGYDCSLRLLLWHHGYLVGYVFMLSTCIFARKLVLLPVLCDKV